MFGGDEEGEYGIFALMNACPLDKYWKDPNMTLTDLLLDENIITELKNENPKLLN